jgi:hypothetical protein
VLGVFITAELWIHSSSAVISAGKHGRSAYWKPAVVISAGKHGRSAYWKPAAVISAGKHGRSAY